MVSKLGYQLQQGMMGMVIGDNSLYTYPAAYEVALFSGGVELSGNGYERAVIATNAVISATWTRSGSTITVDVGQPHGLATAEVVTLSASSDLSAAPLGDESITVTGDNTFTFAGVAAGGASGTLSYQPDTDYLFWSSQTGTDGRTNYVQARAITWPAAASGDDWNYDEVRLIKNGTSGTYMMAFVWDTTQTLADGDTLTIPAGTFSIEDVSDA